MARFDGLGMGLGTLSRLSDAQTRSISPENPTGAKGAGAMAETGTASVAARDLGRGWKVNPYVVIEPGATLELANIEGQGAIQQIWMTLAGGKWRFSILRAYWDDQEQPSIEAPAGDFFACGWEMPFRRRARFTMTNLSDEPLVVYYQINYTLTTVPEDCAYFHAQFRRTNPLPYKEVYTILDGVRGQGHFAGVYMAWGVHNAGWWGEGEIKFYLDGDAEFPTIAGTGTEDYFCGAYNFDPGSLERRQRPDASRYQEFTTAYAGLPQVIRPDGVYQSQQRFGMYRWHVMDPVRFQCDLRITIQALGWRTHKKLQYLPLQDDIASCAFWYQTLPTAPFPALPGRDHLEVI